MVAASGRRLTDEQALAYFESLSDAEKATFL